MRGSAQLGNPGEDATGFPLTATMKNKVFIEKIELIWIKQRLRH